MFDTLLEGEDTKIAVDEESGGKWRIARIALVLEAEVFEPIMAKGPLGNTTARSRASQSWRRAGCLLALPR